MTTNAERWAHLQARTPTDFFYAVTTTGIYCRAGCASRLPRREHVRFFDTASQAEQAGFRPCKRCAPHQPGGAPHQAAVLAACARLRAAEVPLADLAAEAGLSVYHFQRVFKRVVGVSPKQFALAARRQAHQAELPMATSISAVSPISLRGELGMTATTYRQGGRGLVVRFACAPCMLGWVLVAVSEVGVCGIELGDSKAEVQAALRARLPHADLQPVEPGAALQEVLAMLAHPAQACHLPLDIRGTAFQQRVWQAVRAIPAGQTCTYAQLAAELGQPQAVRAVARAVASNPLAVAVPCHRVVGSNGSLRGYRWGLPRKAQLLQAERPGEDEAA